VNRHPVLASPFALVVLLVAVACTRRPAPALPVAPTGVVRGTVIDTVGGAPVPRARVSLDGRMTVRTDNEGRYLLGPIVTLPRTLTVECHEERRSLRMRLLASRPVEVTRNDTIFANFAVDGRGCDLRPWSEVTGEFRGRWTVGFEANDFVPCRDSEAVRPRRWSVTFGRGGTPRHWQSVPTDSFGLRTYFVRWRGTRVGPGYFGHLGGGEYQLTVTDVREMRAQRPGDCR